MAKTLPLSADWDLTLDPAGNLLLTDPDASIAQDVASAIRTFLGECWYDTTLGLPYFEAILGQRPPRSLVVDQIQQAALTVPDVASASVTFLGLKDRVLTGVVLVTRTTSATPLTVTF
jgi:hypothetical protein